MNMSVNNNRPTHISSQSLQSAKAELQNKERTLGSEIRGVKNSIDKLDTSIKSNQSSLNTLNAISDKHGGDASIRLKGNNFKPGSGNALFSGSRYQKERADAATKLGVPGKEVSASKAISIVSSEIKNDKAELTSLKQDLGHKETELKDVRIRQVREGKMGNVTTAKASTDKANAQTKQARENFSLIYQSNAGCKALNAEARYQSGQSKTPGSLSGSKVIAEYQRSKGDDIFSGGNKDIKNTINSCSTNLSSLVKTGAKAWYTPGGDTIKTHRGQGMTQEGFKALTNGQAYKLGQFFSTSTNPRVAETFANSSKEALKVMFEIEGNSSRGIFVGNGLKFDNNEGEKIYSPLANFKVLRKVSADTNGICKVVLKEVKPSDNAPLLPY